MNLRPMPAICVWRRCAIAAVAAAWAFALPADNVARAQGGPAGGGGYGGIASGYANGFVGGVRGGLRGGLRGGARGGVRGGMRGGARFRSGGFGNRGLASPGHGSRFAAAPSARAAAPGARSPRHGAPAYAAARGFSGRALGGRDDAPRFKVPGDGFYGHRRGRRAGRTFEHGYWPRTYMPRPTFPDAGARSPAFGAPAFAAAARRDPDKPVQRLYVVAAAGPAGDAAPTASEPPPEARTERSDRAEAYAWTPRWDGYYAALAPGDAPAIGGIRLAPPAGATAVAAGDWTFIYADGVFYAERGGFLEVVPPPLGAEVAAVPAACETLTVSGIEHRNCAGAFYRVVEAPIGPRYRVVPAPLGAMLSALPPGASEVTVAGERYFSFGGALYSRSDRDGATRFTVTGPPSG